MGDFEFTPGIVGTFITVLLILLFVYLGFWQLSRMEEKKLLAENLKNRMNAEVIDFSQVTEAMIDRDINDFRFQRMTVSGQFLENRDILLDNQIFNGHAGYDVITPFLPTGSNTLILVDRGWIPWGEDRNELPKIQPILGNRTLVGTINQYAPGLKLGEEETTHHLWPLRVQTVDYDDLEGVFKQPIAHFVLLLPTGSSEGFSIRPIYFGLPADRHLGYAVQWFTMAVAVLLYYLVVNLRSTRSNTE